MKTVELAIFLTLAIFGRIGWHNRCVPQEDVFSSLREVMPCDNRGVYRALQSPTTLSPSNVAASAPIASVDGADAEVMGEAFPTPHRSDAVDPQGSRLPPPSDPLQACAQKALCGDYGQLEPWQQEAYESTVERNVTAQGLAWVTVYCPPWFPRGKKTRSGFGCSEKVAAANRIAQGKWVWVQDSPAGGATVRQILDTGSQANYRRARLRGADLWIDIWHPRSSTWSTVCGYAAW